MVMIDVAVFLMLLIKSVLIIALRFFKGVLSFMFMIMGFLIFLYEIFILIWCTHDPLKNYELLLILLNITWVAPT